MLFFSVPDIALVIKYMFNDYTKQPESKKRKLTDIQRDKNVMEYSIIKLPCLFFIKYLETYFADYLTACQR
jgi:hypothetical protein